MSLTENPIDIFDTATTHLTTLDEPNSDADDDSPVLNDSIASAASLGSFSL